MGNDAEQDAILGEIAAERARQDVKWGAEHDDKHSVDEWDYMIGYYLQRVRIMAPRQRRVNLIKVAALAVAAIESMDRLAQAGE